MAIGTNKRCEGEHEFNQHSMLQTGSDTHRICRQVLGSQPKRGPGVLATALSWLTPPVFLYCALFSCGNEISQAWVFGQVYDKMYQHLPLPLTALLCYALLRAFCCSLSALASTARITTQQGLGGTWITARKGPGVPVRAHYLCPG